MTENRILQKSVPFGNYKSQTLLERLRNEIRQPPRWLRQQTPAPASRRQVPQALLRASFAGLRKWTAELIKPQLACG